MIKSRLNYFSLEDYSDKELIKIYNREKHEFENNFNLEHIYPKLKFNNEVIRNQNVSLTIYNLIKPSALTLVKNYLLNKNLILNNLISIKLDIDEKEERINRVDLFFSFFKKDNEKELFYHDLSFKIEDIRNTKLSLLKIDSYAGDIIDIPNEKDKKEESNNLDYDTENPDFRVKKIITEIEKEVKGNQKLESKIQELISAIKYFGVGFPIQDYNIQELKNIKYNEESEKVLLNLCKKNAYLLVEKYYGGRSENIVIENIEFSIRSNQIYIYCEEVFSKGEPETCSIILDDINLILHPEFYK